MKGAHFDEPLHPTNTFETKQKPIYTVTWFTHSLLWYQLLGIHDNWITCQYSLLPPFSVLISYLWRPKWAEYRINMYKFFMNTWLQQHRSMDLAWPSYSNDDHLKVHSLRLAGSQRISYPNVQWFQPSLWNKHDDDILGFTQDSSSCCEDIWTCLHVQQNGQMLHNLAMTLHAFSVSTLSTQMTVSQYEFNN